MVARVASPEQASTAQKLQVKMKRGWWGVVVFWEMFQLPSSYKLDSCRQPYEVHAQLKSVPHYKVSS